MANGYVEFVKLGKMMTSLDRIIKIRKKYDKCLNEVKVMSEISISFSPRFNTMWVLLNGNKYIKYNYGHFIGGIKSFTTGITAGIAEGAISFETNDKTVISLDYVKRVEELIRVSIPDIENQFINASQKKWRS